MKIGYGHHHQIETLKGSTYVSMLFQGIIEYPSNMVEFTQTKLNRMEIIWYYCNLHLQIEFYNTVVEFWPMADGNSLSSSLVKHVNNRIYTRNVSNNEFPLKLLFSACLTTRIQSKVYGNVQIIFNWIALSFQLFRYHMQKEEIVYCAYVNVHIG